MDKLKVMLITKVPDDVKDDFDSNLLRDNYSRIIPVLMVLYVIEWIVFAFSEKLYDTGYTVLCFQVFNTIIILASFIIYRRIDHIPRLLSKTVINIIALGFLAFGIALVMATQDQTDLIHMYLMCALGVAAFIMMPPVESLIMYSLSLALFWILIPVYQSDSSIILVEKVNTTIFIFMVWILSRRLFQYKLRDYLANADLLKKNRILEELVQKDQMTGLLNHKTILDKLEDEISRTQRYKHDLSVVIMDIDNFKQVNDRFGHQQGDEIIIKLANIILAKARKTDLVGRYGGEEFMIVMPSTDLKEACKFCQRLQSSLKGLILPDNTGITISGGIVQYSGSCMDKLIKAADDKLYYAKSHGKNQFIHN